MTTPSKLQTWVENWIATAHLPKSFHLEGLAGDGSPRPFFRLRAGNRSFVVLFEPEWILSKDYAPHQEALKKAGIPVPEFFAVDPKSGILVMEDLGDELLQNRILKKGAEKMGWLTQSAELLADLHGRLFPVNPKLPVSTRSFDATKFGEELQFTFLHLSEKLLGNAASDGTSQKKIQEFCQKISAISPQVFCHRDYHTRNILLSGEKLYLIDFQDARLGSPQYDLGSLIYDAYIPLTTEERAKLTAAYLNRLKNYPVYKTVSVDDFQVGLDLVSFQRVVKAAGSFASFYTRYGKTTHLSYLKPALETAKAIQKRQPSIQDLLPVDKWLEQVATLKVK